MGVICGLMIESLIPHQLTPAASLNRLVISQLPGTIAHADLMDRRASTLVGAEAVLALIRLSAKALHLEPEMLEAPTPELFAAFDACLESDNMRIQAAAHRVARQFARNLAALLIVLRRGDERNRATRPDWDATYWDYWASVPRIWLGGGLIRGHLRDTLIHDISVLFHRADTPFPDLRLDPHGEYLPLVGAARCASAGCASALVMDFGHTGIKRGLARYEHDTLTHLHPLPTLPTRHIDPANDAALRGLLWSMQGTIINAYQQTQPDCPIIPVSIAAYLNEWGQPMAMQGGVYAALSRITPSVQDALGEAVRAHTGREVQVTLIHDGTAAATTHPHDAVITLGTAIGNGMAPAVEYPLPIADDFQIT